MQLVKYDAMVNAITICESVDEVKDIRDKAVALEAYAKQANNHEAEHKCALVRVRAERKCGQMLQSTPKAKGAATPSSESSASIKTLGEMGISHDQSSTWQKLANVPDDEFEEAIAPAGIKPSATRIVKASEPNPDLPTEPMPRMNEQALWWWGFLTRMEKEGRLDLSIPELLSEMTDNMKAQSEPLFTELKGFINAK